MTRLKQFQFPTVLGTTLVPASSGPCFQTQLPNTGQGMAFCLLCSIKQGSRPSVSPEEGWRHNIRNNTCGFLYSYLTLNPERPVMLVSYPWTLVSITHHAFYHYLSHKLDCYSWVFHQWPSIRKKGLDRSPHHHHLPGTEARSPFFSI